MLVDSHHHLWRVANGYPWLDDPALAPIRRDFGVADLRAALAGTGVQRTVLVEAGRCAAAEVGEFLAVADATEEIAGVVGWVDLTDPALAETLRGHKEKHGGRWLVGVRAQVQGEPDPDYLARDDVLTGLSTVADTGLAYDLVVRVDQLAAAATAARRVPGLTFVLDHLGKPRIRDGAAGLAGWRAVVAPLAAQPNVYAKLSGLVTEAASSRRAGADRAQWTVSDLRPFVETAVELFGPDRLMYGSDWPVCLLAASSYAQVKRAYEDAIGAAGSDAVYGGNAVRCYKLEV